MGAQRSTQIGPPFSSRGVGYGGNLVYSNPMLSTGGGLGQPFVFGNSRGGQAPRDLPSGSGSGGFPLASGGFPLALTTLCDSLLIIPSPQKMIG